MHYFQKLKDLRESKDKKQVEIAEYLNITQQQYQLYESGKRELPAHFFVELAKLYNVSTDYILGLTNDKRKYW